MQIILNADLAIDIEGYIYYIALMLFLLHHSTGALVLSADDRNQVLLWSKRQLGRRAHLASVVELDEPTTVDWVEKSGTGIRGSILKGCEAKFSFMADSVQRLEGLDQERVQSLDSYRTATLKSCNASVN